jgi:hypothetical protein
MDTSVLASLCFWYIGCADFSPVFGEAGAACYWKRSDPDVPILKETEAEYAKSDRAAKEVHRMSDHTGSGLPENIAALLSYVLGWITVLVFLLIDKRHYVRFHAAQSIVVFLGPQGSHQKRPTVVTSKAANGSGLGLGCFTPPPPEEASPFWCANSVARI